MVSIAHGVDKNVLLFFDRRQRMGHLPRKFTPGLGLTGVEHIELKVCWTGLTPCKESWRSPYHLLRTMQNPRAGKVDLVTKIDCATLIRWFYAIAWRPYGCCYLVQLQRVSAKYQWIARKAVVILSWTVLKFTPCTTGAISQHLAFTFIHVTGAFRQTSMNRC